MRDVEKQGIDVYSIIEKTIEEHGYDYEQPSRTNVILRKFMAWLKSKYPDILIFIGYVISLYQLLYMFSRAYWGIYYLEPLVFGNIERNAFLGIIVPVISWFSSTCLDFWQYKTRKLTGLIIVLLNVGMVFYQLFFSGVAYLVVPLLLKIPISPDITIRMVLNLTRLIISLIMIITFSLIYMSLFKNMFDPNTIGMIMRYKLNKRWDTRYNKKFCYDLEIVRYMTNGKMHRIFEKDRFLHCMSVGTTGTGKTSTCMEVSINNDLDRRMKNEDWLKRKISKMLKKGQVKMTRDFDDAEFSVNYFVADKAKYKKKIMRLQKKAKIAGITAMAPNESFSDTLYMLAKLKSIKANRIDPNLDENGLHKEGFIGFNPLYISPIHKGLRKKLEIFSKARLFADVNQAIFEKDETGDIYFTSLNRNLTTAITIMVLLTYPSLNNGKQPTPDVVQDIINDFSKAKVYRDELVRLYSTKFNNKKEKKDPIMDPGKANIGEYQFVLDVIDHDLLGEGRREMENQARGLKNIINEILSNPLIRDVLCAENTIDLDNNFETGQITFVNYALNLGSAGIAFGMFFLLSFINAALRRPVGKNLLPHFAYIDELPELLHPELGRAFALFRQYMVSMFVALQSLDQLDRSPKTKYLKNVLLGGCAHQFVFGRMSNAEMQIYQDLSGTKLVTKEMSGVSETALSMENTSLSTTKREIVQKEPYLEGGNMRYMDFREVTVFTVTKGSPERPFYGKTFFLEDIKKVKIRRYRFNWSNYFVTVDGFTEKVSKPQSSVASRMEVIEFERVLSDIERKQIGTEKTAETVVHEQEIKLNNISSNKQNEIFLSSGKENVDTDASEHNDFDDDLMSAAFEIDINEN